jgi:nucleotide-binding universal stress UspA family protein
MIPEFKKILFTTDLSKNSHTAYYYALSLASRYGAGITILHVMEEMSASSGARLRDFIGDERWDEIKESHEQEARQALIGKKREGSVIHQALGDFAEQAHRDLDDRGIAVDEILVTRGNVVDEILQEAQNRQCDLIVMGYHVRGKLEEAILGSTPRRLLRRCSIPIMLVRLPADGS